MKCFFVSDLHGKRRRYQLLFDRISVLKPHAVFIGGDLLASAIHLSDYDEFGTDDFIRFFFRENLERIKSKLGDEYPRIFTIPGNDDGRSIEGSLLELESEGLLHYINGKHESLGGYDIYGYCYVPPTPFQLKDWERYDVSRYVDPGCLPIEEGKFTFQPDLMDLIHGTIEKDLQKLTGDQNLNRSIFLFHSPPYNSCLDRAALDGRTIDHVPLDVNVGSIAIRKFIENRQPYLTLHGHIHESARLTGCWHEMIGRTHIIGAAHDGPELALIHFCLENLDKATKELL